MLLLLLALLFTKLINRVLCISISKQLIGFLNLLWHSICTVLGKWLRHCAAHELCLERICISYCCYHALLRNTISAPIWYKFTFKPNAHDRTMLINVFMTSFRSLSYGSTSINYTNHLFTAMWKGIITHLSYNMQELWHHLMRGLGIEVDARKNRPSIFHIFTIQMK
jgi:hypothetical protein